MNARRKFILMSAAAIWFSGAAPAFADGGDSGSGGGDSGSGGSGSGSGSGGSGSGGSGSGGGDDSDNDSDDDDDDNGSTGGKRRDSDQERVRAAVASGRVVSLKKLNEHLRDNYAGKVLSIDIRRRLGRYMYQVKMLQAGNRVKSITLDGMTLEAKVF